MFLPVLHVSPSGWRLNAGGQAHFLLFKGPGKHKWEQPELEEQPFWPKNK